MTAGRLLFPSVGVVQNRNTYDTMVNGGINPILHLGSNSITFNGGLQFTVRRDKISPRFMNQDLFRQFLYVYTSSFFNWVSFTGTAQREAGPFTEQNLHSRDLFGNIEFTVGRPWGSTSLIAGYSARDLLFRPFVEEYFSTSTYGGLQHKFGNRLDCRRARRSICAPGVCRTRNTPSPRRFCPEDVSISRATRHWDVQGSFVLSRGMGYHSYDNAQSEFLVSYTRGWRGSVKDGDINVPVSFPMRFSVGVQQQTFLQLPRIRQHQQEHSLARGALHPVLVLMRHMAEINQTRVVDASRARQHIAEPNQGASPKASGRQPYAPGGIRDWSGSPISSTTWSRRGCLALLASRMRPRSIRC